MYLPHVAQVLYVLVLRRHMCFATGVVGRTYRLSEKAMIERTEVHRQRGSTVPGYKATRQQLRTALSQLERAGLIVSMPDEMNVFRLPLAFAGSIRPDEEQPNAKPNEQPNEQPEEQPQEQPSSLDATTGKTRVILESVRDEQPKEQPQEQPHGVWLEQPDEQPTSVVFSVQQQQQQNPPPPNADSDGCFLMHRGWKPSDWINTQLKMAGIVDYNPLILTEFVCFWSDPDNNERRSQAKWDRGFLDQVIRKTRTPNMQSHQNAIKAAARQTARKDHGTAAARFEEARRKADESGVFADDLPGVDDKETIPGNFKVVAP